jgi:uncharacterized membrane protein
MTLLLVILGIWVILSIVGVALVVGGQRKPTPGSNRWLRQKFNHGDD